MVLPALAWLRDRLLAAVSPDYRYDRARRVWHGINWRDFARKRALFWDPVGQMYRAEMAGVTLEIEPGHIPPYRGRRSGHPKRTPVCVRARVGPRDGLANPISVDAIPSRRLRDHYRDLVDRPIQWTGDAIQIELEGDLAPLRLRVVDVMIEVVTALATRRA